MRTSTITAAPDTETRLPARPDGSPWPMLLIHGDRVTGAVRPAAFG